MAISFREFPWYIQALLFVALAALLIGAGEFVPYSPVQQVRAQVEQANAQYATLNQEVNALRVYERRYAEFRAEMEALQKQLDTLRTIVPEEKELDGFIRMVQGAATASNVQIRSMAAQAVVSKDYHYEMPFEVTVDGPYYNILDFFARLGRLSRIINVGDLTFGGVAGSRTRYPLRPGTTVSGSFRVTTFFTKPGEDAAAAAAAKKAPGGR